MAPLVLLDRVSRSFAVAAGRVVKAVDDISIAIEQGRTLGLVGESGSGKSTLGRLAVGLQVPDKGRVTFGGQDLQGIGKRELRGLRSQMMVVFQEPLQSLNPSMRVKTIVGEPLAIHCRSMDRDKRHLLVTEALARVGLGKKCYDAYPSELSGGQQQRVGIARAVVTRPRFLVLDEPTSALDMSTRVQVLDLLKSLQGELGMTFLMISHDISTIEFMSDYIAVMYRGRIVEIGAADEVIYRPHHGYTRYLLESRLSIDRAQSASPRNPEAVEADGPAEPDHQRGTLANRHLGGQLDE
jgi:ABC-type glutathione transport system ATPase component